MLRGCRFRLRTAGHLPGSHHFCHADSGRVSCGSVEEFGIVYLEAGASGLPVLAARTGGADAVREDETGLLVPPDDPAELAQALSRLLNDAALRQRLGRAGRLWVKREMNWDRAVQQVLSILSAAVGRNSSGQ